ncbi:MAG: iron dicitrate transport regulator FecR [Pseudoxanthomonas spadix]|nr:MAG: iron dicitrate transport regulator FecR [Pseudoxanthomonas spadix]
MSQRKPTEKEASPSKTVLAARAEASVWITRLHGPGRGPELEAGFRRWLAEHPENAQEFEGLTEVWDLLSGSVPSGAALRLERWEHSAEARELRALRTQTFPIRARRWRRRGWAMAACAVLAAIGVLLHHLTAGPAPYVTAVGEQRTVRLEDGSRLTLNADSRVTTDLTGAERRVQLERGEALFEVAKDARRPFVVIVDGHSVTALGTTFVVRRDAHRVAVTLIEGRVAVATLTTTPAGDNRHASPAPSADILTPGERIILGDRVPVRIDTPRLDAVTAWRRGEVLLDNTPLSEAAAEMNRYDRTGIVIDSARARAVRLSGLYHVGDNAGFAGSVAQMHGLQLEQRGGHIHLR